MFAGFPSGTYRSLRLVNMKFNKAPESDAFLADAWAALALIEHNDPAAWHLVEREIAYVVNMYLSSAGQYDLKSRACDVDYEKCFKGAATAALNSPEREWYIAALAGTIVHEAMHGRLFSWGIPYNRATRARVERLCHLRQRRFLARLHSDHYDLTTICGPFDVTRWYPHWGYFSRLRRMKEPWSRFRRDLKSPHK